MAHYYLTNSRMQGGYAVYDLYRDTKCLLSGQTYQKCRQRLFAEMFDNDSYQELEHSTVMGRVARMRERIVNASVEGYIPVETLAGNLLSEDDCKQLMKDYDL